MAAKSKSPVLSVWHWLLITIIATFVATVITLLVPNAIIIWALATMCIGALVYAGVATARHPEVKAEVKAEARASEVPISTSEVPARAPLPWPPIETYANPKFTKGDWHQYDNGGKINSSEYGRDYANVVWGPKGPGHGTIAKCNGYHGADNFQKEAEANAKLCAAAPHLYHALIDLLIVVGATDCCNGVCVCGTDERDHTPPQDHSYTDAGNYRAQQAVASARAALCRAENGNY